MLDLALWVVVVLAVVVVVVVEVAVAVALLVVLLLLAVAYPGLALVLFYHVYVLHLAAIEAFFPLNCWQAVPIAPVLVAWSLALVVRGFVWLARQSPALRHELRVPLIARSMVV